MNPNPSTDGTYWHGGKPGLVKGDVLLPREPGDVAHLVDGCPTCEARRVGAPLADDNLDPALVYVTTDVEYARVYAAGYPRGALYRVQPVGELTPSPDPVPSWGCSLALILSVRDRLVSADAKQVRRWQRRFAGVSR